VFLALACAACAGRTVLVADGPGFERMGALLAPMFRASGLVDAKGAYLTSSFPFRSLPDDAGRRFLRMSQAFRFDPAAASAVGSFADSVEPDDDLRVGATGFILTRGMQRIAVDLLAVADWDGNGRDDWLARCVVAAPDSAQRREYYLLILNVPAGPLRARVLGVYDCRDGQCALYATAADLRRLPPEPDVLELVSGQRTVTSPPAAKTLPPETF
jgi:hypothetical protein